MRICFVNKGNVHDKAQKETAGADLYVFGFGGLGEVCYEKEWKQETHGCKDVALLSGHTQALVVCGCYTKIGGKKRKSMIVASCNRVLGISDMCHVVDRSATSGTFLRVYDTKIGRIGVVVAEDLFFPENFQALTTCGCDMVVCAFEKVEMDLVPSVLRAFAYCYGVPIIFCGEGYCAIASAKGKLEFSSTEETALVHFEKSEEFHLIETRKRGFF